MVALFRAVQMIVRTRLTDRERPFSVIGPAPWDVRVEGIDSHNVAFALLALRIDEGTWFALINFHLMLLFLSVEGWPSAFIHTGLTRARGSMFTHFTPADLVAILNIP